MAKNKTVKIGDKVNIFYDPITVTRFEGSATVKNIISMGYKDKNKVYRLQVEFDCIPGTIFNRTYVLWYKK